MLYALILFVLLSGVQGMTREDCPAGGRSANGYWDVNNKADEPRCVLKCFNGYEPDGCHVLRRIQPDTWNQKIPQCVEKSLIPWKTVAKAGVAVAAGAGAVAAAPVVLSAAGFTSAGVAAVSIAAGLQVGFGLVY
ncbi:uncharacterized protein LOC127872652 [Dreissena polymorpha]|uniref:uncharacterized protein LOC127872652 n=1 Tax=Dreissena polymorpha TaxID=45954 RepID=UPI002265612E|nr:uncharacterized protein LOC127872652 [Dreissena polymorpha]